MIVADTGGLIVLLDTSEARHAALKRYHDATRGRWIVPAAVIPEVDYMASSRLGAEVARAFHADVESGAWRIEPATGEDVARALELRRRHADLALGYVDAIVMAMAERFAAGAIATTDGRHFRAVRLDLGESPLLLPLDPYPETG